MEKAHPRAFVLALHLKNRALREDLGLGSRWEAFVNPARRHSNSALPCVALLFEPISRRLDAEIGRCVLGSGAPIRRAERVPECLELRREILQKIGKGPSVKRFHFLLKIDTLKAGEKFSKIRLHGSR